MRPWMRSIAAACMLGYLDFRFTDKDWRTGRSGLAAWYATVSGGDPASSLQQLHGQAMSFNNLLDLDACRRCRLDRICKREERVRSQRRALRPHARLLDRQPHSIHPARQTAADPDRRARRRQDNRVTLHRLNRPPRETQRLKLIGGGPPLRHDLPLR